VAASLPEDCICSLLSTPRIWNWLQNGSPSVDPTVAGQPCVLGPKTDEILPCCCFGNHLDSSTCFSCSPENLRIQPYCLLQSCSSCYSVISYKITNNLNIQCRRHNNLWMQLACMPQEVDLTSSFASIWTHNNSESSLELWALLARPETKNDQFPHMILGECSTRCHLKTW
jgi:hypothetical protein